MAVVSLPTACFKHTAVVWCSLVGTLLVPASTSWRGKGRAWCVIVADASQDRFLVHVVVFAGCVLPPLLGKLRCEPAEFEETSFSSSALLQDVGCRFIEGEDAGPVLGVVRVGCGSGCWLAVERNVQSFIIAEASCIP